MFTGHRYLRPTLLAAMVAVAAPACAAQGPYYRYPSPRATVDNRAYDNGYRQGRRDGEADARRRRSPDFSRHRDYRNATDGYRGGNRGAYRDLYREGFAVGYNDGYKLYARGGYSSTYPAYPTNPKYPSGPYNARYRSQAAENGFRDGYEQGRSDGRDGDRYDPVRAARYRSGDRDYDRRYGGLEDYKRDYRAAFKQGYDQGYRENRRR